MYKHYLDHTEDSHSHYYHLFAGTLIVSSAKLTTLEWFMSLEMSDSRTRNNRGPSTVPCGTPLSTGPSLLTPPGRRTKCFLSKRKSRFHFPKFPVIPKFLSLCKSTP